MACRVLRVKPGDRINVLLDDGRRVVVQGLNSDNRGCRIAVKGVEKNGSEMPIEVSAAVA